MCVTDTLPPSLPSFPPSLTPSPPSLLSLPPSPSSSSLRDSAHDTVRTVVALGCSINPPSSPSSFSSSSATPGSLSIRQLSRDYSESQTKIRNFRGQNCFAVTSGKWSGRIFSLYML